jgi:hypothetical protein
MGAIRRLLNFAATAAALAVTGRLVLDYLALAGDEFQLRHVYLLLTLMVSAQLMLATKDSR